MHEHVNDPIVLLHVCEQPPLLVRHSLMSTQPVAPVPVKPLAQGPHTAPVGESVHELCGSHPPPSTAHIVTGPESRPASAPISPSLASMPASRAASLASMLASLASTFPSSVLASFCGIVASPFPASRLTSRCARSHAPKVLAVMTSARRSARFNAMGVIASHYAPRTPRFKTGGDDYLERKNGTR